MLIFEALGKRASDIFFDPKPNGTVVVRYRVDGALRVIEEMNASLGASTVSAIKVAAGMDITEKRRPQDGAFSCVSSRGPASFRVASVGAFGGEKITIRVLSSTAGPMTLKDAGVSGENLKIMQSAIRMPSGMILMCGPTGSGKTSTLYAMLQAIDYSMKNVISIEDPIEHVMENISQMEVNTKADITFAKLLRNALRQNPDIICLGEIRDEETAQVSAHAAQTGHLIIATVHSNDNLGTIDRLVNLGIPLRSVAATLQLIVSAAAGPQALPLQEAGGTFAGAQGIFQKPESEHEKRLRAGRLPRVRRNRLQRPDRPVRPDDHEQLAAFGARSRGRDPVEHQGENRSGARQHDPRLRGVQAGGRGSHLSR